MFPSDWPAFHSFELDQLLFEFDQPTFESDHQAFEKQDNNDEKQDDNDEKQDDNDENQDNNDETQDTNDKNQDVVDDPFEDSDDDDIRFEDDNDNVEDETNTRDERAKDKANREDKEKNIQAQKQRKKPARKRRTRKRRKKPMKPRGRLPSAAVPPSKHNMNSISKSGRNFHMHRDGEPGKPSKHNKVTRLQASQMEDESKLAGGLPDTRIRQFCGSYMPRDASKESWDYVPEELCPHVQLPYWLRSEADNCVAVSLASALVFLGYEDFARQIINKSIELGRYFGTYNTFVGVINSVCSKVFRVKRDRSYQLNPFRHDLDTYPAVLQLKGKDYRNNHCVTVCNGYYFDGNWENVLINTRSNYEWSCGKYGFWKLTRCYRLEPVPKLRKRKRLPFTVEDMVQKIEDMKKKRLGG